MEKEIFIGIFINFCFWSLSQNEKNKKDGSGDFDLLT